MRLIDCVDIVGKSVAPFADKKTFVSTGAVDKDKIILDSTETVDYENKPSRANLEAEEGDILFAKMKGTIKTIILDSANSQYIYSTGFFAVRPKPNIITTDCLYYLINSDSFNNQKDKYSSGATQKAITNSGLSKVIVNIPEYTQQDRISKTLYRIDDMLSIMYKQIDSMDVLIKSRFVEMFGDLKTNPYYFTKKKLIESCEITTGNTPSRAVTEYYGDYIEWIKTDNIVIDKLYPTQATESLSKDGMKVGRIVDKNSILMSCIAGSISSIGRVCITNRKVAFNQQINAITPKEYNVFFLYIMLQLSKEYLVEEINMALKGILSKSKLGDKVFIIPPVELQDQFADFVTKVEQQKSTVQKSIDRLETLKKSLMQEYFG